jgi:hypothetical protein
MPCKLDRYDIKRIETVANSALLILGVGGKDLLTKPKRENDNFYHSKDFL